MIFQPLKKNLHNTDMIKSMTELTKVMVQSFARTKGNSAPVCVQYIYANYIIFVCKCEKKRVCTCYLLTKPRVHLEVFYVGNMKLVNRLSRVAEFLA